MTSEVTATSGTTQNATSSVESKAEHTTSASGVAKRKLAEIQDAPPAPEPKRRPITPLSPTDSSTSWTKVTIGWLESKGINWALKPLLTKFTKPNVSEESWKVIDAIDISSISTFGDLEKLLLKVIDQVEKNSQERKEEIHGKLRNSLKTYAEVGKVQGLALLTELIKNP